MPRYNKDNVPPPDDPGWGLHRKKVLARMYKIDGPIEVETKEGTLSSINGYLALDSAGYPYLIRQSDYDDMYEYVGPLNREADLGFPRRARA